MNAPWAKLMIFITPNTINRPLATINRIAAVVRISSASAIMKFCSEKSYRLRGDVARRRHHKNSGFQVRALVAGIDALKTLDDLDAAITLDLPQIHVQGRVMLLGHDDRSARSGHADCGERLQHGRAIRAAGLFDRRLVRVDRFVFRNRKIVRRFRILAELPGDVSQKGLVRRGFDSRDIGGRQEDAFRIRSHRSSPFLHRPRDCHTAV